MKIQLSPMDYYFFRPEQYTIKFVFEYDGRIDSSLLQIALDKLATVYIPIKCKLEKISDIYLELVEQPLPFPVVIQEASDTPTDLIEPVKNLPGEYLFKLKLTYVKNKTYLGVTFSHILGDGQSFLQLLMSLSQLMNNFAPKVTPNLDRSILEQIDSSYPTGSLKKLFASTGYTYAKSELEKTKLEKTLITFSEIESLKLNSPSRVSTNALMMALLLNKYHHLIPLTQEGKLVVRCPVDYRKIYSKISVNYFGNAVKDALAMFDPKTFEHLNIYEIAESIQQSIDQVNEYTIRKTLKTLDDVRREHSIGIFENLSCPGLLVTNVSKLPFHEISMNVGALIAVHHLSPHPRMAVIMSHPEGYEVQFSACV